MKQIRNTILILGLAIIGILCCRIEVHAEDFVCPECGYTDYYYDNERDYTYYSDEQHSYTVDVCCALCDHRTETTTLYKDHEMDWDDEVYIPSNEEGHIYRIIYKCEYCDNRENRDTVEAHDWDFIDDETKPYSDSKHQIIKDYKCYDCGQTISKTEYESHDWEEDYFKDWKYTYVNSTTHKVSIYYYCYDCGATKTKTVEKAHTGTGYCIHCTFPKTSTTLKSGSYVYRNGRVWLKIVAPQTGYITLNVNSEYGYDTFYFYNSDKKIYSSVYLKNGSKIPVMKGTYYIKWSDSYSDNYRVKYTFTALAYTSNYSKSTAVTLKPNVAKKDIIFTSKGSKAWKKYYKITLTKSSRIYVWMNGYGESIYSHDLYSKNGDWCMLDYVNTSSTYTEKYVSDKVLKPGTYYLMIEGYWNYADKSKTPGIVYSLKWNYK